MDKIRLPFFPKLWYDGVGNIILLIYIEVTFMETWYLLDTKYKDAATNMAIDEALLLWHSENKIPPVLRFYGWSKPSLSIGHFQNVQKSIDLQAVTKHQCQLVRRLTGGSAVLHDDELTYSMIVSEKHPKIPTTVNDAYYELAQGILNGYKELGIDAEFAIPKSHLRKERTAVCFEKPAIYELVVNGKKISGNAQTRKHGVLLQHGSIPFSFDVDMLFDLFTFSSEEKRMRQKERFFQKARSINQLTNQNFSYNDLKNAFIKGFQSVLHVRFEPIELNEEQWQFVDHLARTKYKTDNWNMHHRKRERV